MSAVYPLLLLQQWTEILKSENSSPQSCRLHWNLMNDEELGSLKLLILKYRRVDQIIHPLCTIGSHPGFGIRKTKACDNRTPRHKNSEAIDVWKVACEKLRATHQVGVSWRTMIIPLRKLQFPFFYNEIYELYN